MKDLSLIPIGTKVQFVTDTALGVITGIAITGAQMDVSYHVAFWNSGTRISDWVNAVEIEPVSSGEMLSMGFAEKWAEAGVYQSDD